MKDGGREVGVGTDDVRGVPGSDTRPPNNKRDVNVFLKTTFFAGVETVLRNMIAVVCGVDNARIIKDIVFLELSYNTVNKLVHCLESLEAGAIEAVIILNDSRVELWESLDPRCTARLGDISH